MAILCFGQCQSQCSFLDHKMMYVLPKRHFGTPCISFSTKTQIFWFNFQWIWTPMGSLIMEINMCFYVVNDQIIRVGWWQYSWHQPGSHATNIFFNSDNLFPILCLWTNGSENRNNFLSSSKSNQINSRLKSIWFRLILKSKRPLSTQPKLFINE